MKNSSIPILLFIISIFFFAISNQLFSHGMFMDGTYYATISRNMAFGLGSFWAPHFTDTLRQQFFDHPPLIFFLQSLFFRLFGDFHWVERLYSLFTYFIGGSLMIIFWKRIAPEAQKHLYWIPILFWITIPKTTWGVSNNLLENTMMLFVIASLIIFIEAFRRKKGTLFFIAGVMIFLGVLSKGFTALYPLSFPFFYWLVKRPFSFLTLIRNYILILVGLIFPLALFVLAFPECVTYFETYLNIQIFSGMDIGHNGRTRLYIIKRVPQELMAIMIISLIIFLINKFYTKSKVLLNENKKWVTIILLTALSGVLPITLSLKQSTFYVIPAFPLFSIAFALIVAPFAQKHLSFNLNRKQYLRLSAFSLFSLFIGLVLLISPSDEIKRDKEKLSDIQKIINYTGRNITVGLDQSIGYEYSYYAYFYRYGYVSLSTQDLHSFPFTIAPKGKVLDLDTYKKVNLNLNTLDLYIEKN